MINKSTSEFAKLMSLKKNTPFRAGFTLIELLIAISIFVILAALIVPAIGYSVNAERVPTAARDIQSMIEGARSRAADAKRPRGVRFLLDPNNTDVVNGMVFIGSPRKYKGGTIEINADQRTFDAIPNLWPTMVFQGTLVNGSRIKIDDIFYTISIDTDFDDDGDFANDGETSDPDDNPANWVWMLTRDFSGTTGAPLSYELDLQASVLPYEDPVLFPQGIVIDLDESAAEGNLPAAWGTTGSYSNQMDILFSPQGTVIGGLAAISDIRLLLADIIDVSKGRGVLDPDKEGDELFISIRPQTGFIESVNVYDNP